MFGVVVVEIDLGILRELAVSGDEAVCFALRIQPFGETQII